MFNRMPSEILGISDSYTAFCFDEACTMLMLRIQKGEEPIFAEDEEERHFSTPSEMYESMGIEIKFEEERR